MTFYDQTKMTELLYNIHLLYKEALPAKFGIRNDNAMVFWSLTKTNSSKHTVWFEANWKHALRLVISLGKQEHAFLRNALRFNPNDLMLTPLPTFAGV